MQDPRKAGQDGASRDAATSQSADLLEGAWKGARGSVRDSLRWLGFEDQQQALDPDQQPPVPAQTPGGPVEGAAAPDPDAGLQLPPATLRMGARGPDVERLQGSLNASGAAIEVDGAFGPKTRAAVVSFQRHHDLSVDGVVGPQTWGALGAGGATPEPGTGNTTGPGTGNTTGPGTGNTTGGHQQGEWDVAYGSRKTWLGQTYEDYKSGIGDLKASSKHGGTKLATPSLTLEQLFFIYPALSADAEADPEVMGKAQSYLGYLNEAFAAMEIDTLEAQAVFLAHACVESDQFRKLSEAQKKRYEDDPHEAELYESDLRRMYPSGSKNGRTINPTGEFNFIGRGPLQVTHRHNFLQTLAYMEKQAEECEAKGDTERSAKLYAAVEAIRADPKEASSPQYTFLFSAAYMKMAGGDERAAQIDNPSFGGKGKESNWMTGGYQDPKGPQKREAYQRALQVLKANVSGKGGES